MSRQGGTDTPEELETGERLRPAANSHFVTVCGGQGIGGKEKERKRQAPERNSERASKLPPSGEKHSQSPGAVPEPVRVRASRVLLKASERVADDDAVPVEPFQCRP